MFDHAKSNANLLTLTFSAVIITQQISSCLSTTSDVMSTTISPTGTFSDVSSSSMETTSMTFSDYSSQSTTELSSYTTADTDVANSSNVLTSTFHPEISETSFDATMQTTPVSNVQTDFLSASLAPETTDMDTSIVIPTEFLTSTPSFESGSSNEVGGPVQSSTVSSAATSTDSLQSSTDLSSSLQSQITTEPYTTSVQPSETTDVYSSSFEGGTINSEEHTSSPDSSVYPSYATTVVLTSSYTTGGTTITSTTPSDMSTSSYTSVDTSSALAMQTSVAISASMVTTAVIDTSMITATQNVSSSDIFNGSSDATTPMSVEPTQSSMWSSEFMSTTIIPTSPPITTDTPTTPTTPSPSTTNPTVAPQYPPKLGNINAAIFTVTFELVFNCTNFNESQIRDEYFADDVFNSLSFESTSSCPSANTSRRKRSTNGYSGNYSATAKFQASLKDTFHNKLNESLERLQNDSKINMTDEQRYGILSEVANQTSDYCDADNYCPSGYDCISTNRTLCYFLCDDRFGFDCGDNGKCYVEVVSGDSSHSRECKCDIDEFYQYEGDSCNVKKMTWQLILAIAGGCAAAIIVILIFIIIITCMRKKRRNNGYDKYSNGSGLDYTDLQARPSSRTYQGLRHTDRGNTGTAQGYENKAYDYRDYIETENDLHYRSDANGSRAANGSRVANGSRALNDPQTRAWNPDESADVYAKLNDRFDDVNYQYNIKRAQLRQSVNNSDVRTGF